MRKWFFATLFTPIIAFAANYSAPSWTYQGDTAPTHWGKLSPAYKTCATGQYQSPINIDTNSVKAVNGQLNIHYMPLHGMLERKNSNVYLSFLNKPAQDYIVFQNKKFSLINLHFHVPAEHTIDGKGFALEAHLVHENSSHDVLIIAVLFATSKTPNTFFQELLSFNFPQQYYVKKLGNLLIDPRRLLPESESFYTYSGSLTTPPCTENAIWIVMNQPLSVTTQQVQAFQQRVTPYNARPLQPLNDRQIGYID